MPQPEHDQVTMKDAAAVDLGRRGGAKGGPARAAKLSQERRSEIARMGAQARNKLLHSQYADESAIEGIKTETVLMAKTRSRKLRDFAFDASKGRCCVCERDFTKVLNGRGVRVLQVHHRQQLASRDTPGITNITDLAVVCANCHLLLHLDAEIALAVEKLKEMLNADRFFETVTDQNQTISTEPDAAMVCVLAAWPALPEHIKAAILTLVGTAQSSQTKESGNN